MRPFCQRFQNMLFCTSLSLSTKGRISLVGINHANFCYLPSFVYIYDGKGTNESKRKKRKGNPTMGRFSEKKATQVSTSVMEYQAANSMGAFPPKTSLQIL